MWNVERGAFAEVAVFEQIAAFRRAPISSQMSRRRILENSPPWDVSRLEDCTFEQLLFSFISLSPQRDAPQTAVHPRVEVESLRQNAGKPCKLDKKFLYLCL